MVTYAALETSMLLLALAQWHRLYYAGLGVGGVDARAVQAMARLLPGGARLLSREQYQEIKDL